MGKTFHIPAAILASFLVANNASAFDAEAEFGATNPSGTWSYGYTASFGSAFVPFDILSTPGFVQSAWQATGRDQFLLLAIDLSGNLIVHPGPGTEHAVLRFTVPTTASYSVSVQFIDRDSGDTSGHVLLNGNTLDPLAHFASTVSSPAYSGTLTLNSGDLLDLVVGNNGDYISDSTGLSVRITAIPEPGSVALLAGIGALSVAVMPRRRRLH